MTKNLFEKSFPDACFDKKEESREEIYGTLIRFIENKSKTSEKEYLSYVDPKITSQITNKAPEIDACYENSRNLVRVDKEETVINFCRYLNLNLTALNIFKKNKLQLQHGRCSQMRQRTLQGLF